MNGEIDLIPAEFRSAQSLRAWLRRFVLVYLGILLSLGIAKAGLAYGTRARAQEVERIEEAAAVAQTQQARLAELRAEKAEVERRLAVLKGLRGGPGAEQMFLAVDRALDGTVQFLDWQFRRAGELVEDGPETVRTGYFIVVPATKTKKKRGRKERERRWLLQTHMQIRARATDHSSLANFVSRLVQQPEIEQVRVLNTHVRQYVSTHAVDFELAVVVRTWA